MFSQAVVLSPAVVDRRLSQSDGIVIAMESTWESRDLPVLAAIVELADSGERNVSKAAIHDRTGLDDETVLRALFALAGEQPPFFHYVDTSTFEGRDIDLIHSPTGHARRTVGAWPTPEGWVDRLVASLEAAAAEEPDAEKRGKLKSAAAIVGGVARDVVIRTASGAITGAM